MWHHSHQLVEKRDAPDCSSQNLVCSGVQVADCVLFCIASAALSGLLTCGAVRCRRKKRCRGHGQGPAQSSVATSPVSKVVVSAKCQEATSSDSSATTADCKHIDGRTVQELHQTICSQMIDTEEALQDAMHGKEASLQQLHAQEQLLANCQQQLMDASLQLKKQRQKASHLSVQTESTIAGLQSKVEEGTALALQLQADLGDEKSRVQHLQEQLHAVEHSWGATKQALDVAQLRISSLRSAKQQSDAQHDRRVQVMAKDLRAAEDLRQSAEKELLFVQEKAKNVASKLEMTGRAVMQTNQEIAQGEQDKAQLEHALMTQAKHSQAVEAELAAANKRTRQLEMDLRVLKECLARGTTRTPLTENVAHDRATSRQ
ncbi:hypothetical protein ABBQ32_011172 [Trebouxia sp. C0010 RCD-2024]